MQIPPVRAALFLEDGRTYMTKLILAFGNFAKAPNNGSIKVKTRNDQPPLDTS